MKGNDFQEVAQTNGRLVWSRLKESGSMHKPTEASDLHVGLMALGRAGDWSVDVDETVSGPDRWFVQIESRFVYLYLEIESPSVIEKCIHFMAPVEPPCANRAGEMQLGEFDRHKVELRRDSEFDDRFFLCVGGGLAAIFVNIAGDDLAAFVGALRQVVEELQKQANEDACPASGFQRQTRSN